MPSLHVVVTSTRPGRLGPYVARWFGVSGGLRAAQAVELLLTTLKVTPVPEGVAIPNVQPFLDDAGTLRPNESVEKSATTMPGESLRWAEALRPLRADKA